jgi:hypothetical protein
MAATNYALDDWEFLEDPDESQIEDEPDWFDHPSLTAEERNPSLVAR